ncbi:MAG: transketolase family protein, partial [Clostridia bacterium]|nr:transketolase family protein [Clostridia bacterium]
KTGAAVKVENHNIVEGLQSAILEALTREKVPVDSVAIKDRFGEVGRIPYLREVMGMTNEDIAKAVKEASALK